MSCFVRTGHKKVNHLSIQRGAGAGAIVGASAGTGTSAGVSKSSNLSTVPVQDS